MFENFRVQINKPKNILHNVGFQPANKILNRNLRIYNPEIHHNLIMIVDLQDQPQDTLEQQLVFEQVDHHSLQNFLCSHGWKNFVLYIEDHLVDIDFLDLDHMIDKYNIKIDNLKKLLEVDDILHVMDTYHLKLEPYSLECHYEQI